MKSMKKNIILSLVLVLCLGFTVKVSAATVELGIPSGGDTDLFNNSSPTLNTSTGGTQIGNVTDESVFDPSAPESGTDLFGQPAAPMLGTTQEILNNGTAQSAAPSKMSIAGLVNWLVGLLNYVVRFIVLLALIAFLYGILKLVFVDASNETERAKARKFMLWGIVSLFVMVSVWGLVNVLKSTVFGEGALIVPQLK